MIPIHELLNRMRWDPHFTGGSFELGYYDRVEGRIILVPFKEVVFSPDDARAFRVVDAEGQTRRVPFHRVRELYQDAQRIWSRRRDAK